MFETAIVEQRAGRGVAGFSGSLLLQGLVVSGVVLTTMWLPVELPPAPELHASLPMPRFRNAVRVVSTSVERVMATQAPRRFTYVPPTVRPVARSTGSPTDIFTDLPIPAGGDHVGLAAVNFDTLLPKAAAPPAPPAPKTDVPKPEPARVPIGGDVLASKLIRRVQPEYPPLARQMRVEGVVNLHAIITREGRIAQLRVIGGHPLLVKAAVAAVEQWVYSPTLLNQKPVEVEAPIEVRFILSK